MFNPTKNKKHRVHPLTYISIVVLSLVFVMLLPGFASSGLELDGTSGIWDNVSPPNTFCLFGEGTNEIRWGAPYPLGSYWCLPYDEQSSYIFEDAGYQEFESGEVFLLGTFTHENFPIYGGVNNPSITSVDLDLTIDFLNPSYQTTVTFTFQHNETPNAPCPDPGCEDVVSLASSIPDQEFGPINGKYYKLQVVGFANCGQPYSAALPFYTVEDQSNEACVYGRLIVQEPAIHIEKQTNGMDADTPYGPIVDVGSTVNWSYVVSNVGNVELSGITVTDDMGTPGDSSDDETICTINDLASGASTTCTHQGIATAGQYANVAEASGTFEGDTYTDSDPSHYFGRDISLDVSGNLELEIVQKNAGPGQVALRDLTGGTAVKPFPGDITAEINSPPGFQVGASYYTVTQEDGSRENADGLLILEDNYDSEQYPLPFSLSYAGSGQRPNTVANLTDDFQSCGSACYSAEYSLNIDLSKLTLDYENDDSLTFYTTFWLYVASI